MPIRFEYEEMINERRGSWSNAFGLTLLGYWSLVDYTWGVSSSPYIISIGRLCLHVDVQSSYHVMNDIPPCDVSAGLSTNTILTQFLHYSYVGPDM